MQSAAIRFGLLGPVEAWSGDTPVDLGPRKRRVLLARLLLDSGRPVSVDRLCRDLWPADRRPAGAVSTVHAHISRLRTALEPRRAAGERATLLVRESSGYTLRAPLETLDTAVFESRLVEATDLFRGGRAAPAHRAVDEALRLWRGPALHEAAEHVFAAPEVNRLQSLRQTAQELKVAVLLELGEAATAATLAEALTVSAPLREASWALLLKSLYAAGRSAEALQQYERFRVSLADELGVDPGPALRDLHLALLNEDSDAILPKRTSGPVIDVTAPDPQLCAAPDGRLPMVGRRHELELLQRSIARAAAGGVRWAVVTGPPGSGKTRLLDEVAQHAARRGFTIARLRCCGSVDDRRSSAVFGPAARLLAQLGGEADASLPARAGEEWSEESALTTVLQKLRDGTTLCLIDELDTFCPACRHLLRHLSVLLRDERVALVCALADVDEAETAALLAGLPRDHAIRLPLPPLTPEDVAGLLSDAYVGGVEDVAEHARALCERSDGNPFMLTELLHLPPDARVGSATRVPAAVASVVQARLDTLPPQVRTLVEHAAVSGERVDVDLLVEVMGLSRQDVLKLIDKAVRSHLMCWEEPAEAPRRPDTAAGGGTAGLGHYRFHGVLRDAVLSSLTFVSRQLLHASMATALGVLPGRHPAEIASHMLQAGPTVSSEELAPACLQAGFGCAQEDRTESTWWFRIAADLAGDRNPHVRREALRGLRTVQRQATEAPSGRPGPERSLHAPLRGAVVMPHRTCA
ncbi:BTAD domain-containing putative transcriptional regulator [Streptomyces sp. NPDC058579]|uniref:BTAD domain-containing putative transcriptional regulator n=1 Tax=Streptomyces sp. NPDC058579 TaxID=3346548 RepID=UPI003660BFD8